MRNNSQDETIKRNYIQKYRFLIQEYEQVKAGTHPRFRFAREFYAFHDTARSVTLNEVKDLLPHTTTLSPVPP